jgi:hypothetical protein
MPAVTMAVQVEAFSFIPPPNATIDIIKVIQRHHLHFPEQKVFQSIHEQDDVCSGKQGAGSANEGYL